MTKQEYSKRYMRGKIITCAIGVAEAAGIFGILYLTCWLVERLA